MGLLCILYWADNLLSEILHIPFLSWRGKITTMAQVRKTRGGGRRHISGDNVNCSVHPTYVCGEIDDCATEHANSFK